MDQAHSADLSQVCGSNAYLIGESCETDPDGTLVAPPFMGGADEGEEPPKTGIGTGDTTSAITNDTGSR